MRSLNHKPFLIIVILFSVCTLSLKAQDYIVSGQIKDSLTMQSVPEAEIYNTNGELLCISDNEGFFKFYTSNTILVILVFTPDYAICSRQISEKDFSSLDVFLSPLSINLSEVEINEKRKEIGFYMYILF